MLKFLLQALMIPGEVAAAGAIEATPDRAYRKASEARQSNTPPGCDSSPETGAATTDVPHTLLPPRVRA